MFNYNSKKTTKTITKVENIDNVYSYYLSNNKIDNRYRATVLTRKTNLNLKAENICGQPFFLIKPVESDSLFGLMKEIEQTVENIKEIEANSNFDNSSLIDEYIYLLDNPKTELLTKLVGFNWKNYLGSLKKIDKVLNLLGKKLVIVNRTDK